MAVDIVSNMYLYNNSTINPVFQQNLHGDTVSNMYFYNNSTIK